MAIFRGSMEQEKRVRRYFRVPENRDEQGAITTVCVYHGDKKYVVDRVLYRSS